MTDPLEQPIDCTVNWRMAYECVRDQLEKYEKDRRHTFDFYRDRLDKSSLECAVLQKEVWRLQAEVQELRQWLCRPAGAPICAGTGMDMGQPKIFDPRACEGVCNGD